MSADVEEANARQLAVDTAALNLAKQRLSASFGQKPPWSGGENPSLLQALADGSTQLVRVTFPLGALPGEAPKTLSASRLGTGAGRQALEIEPRSGPRPRTQPCPGAASFRYCAPANWARAKESLRGRRSVPRSPACWFPADAAVISDGKYWCYIEAKPGTFVRTEIDAGKPFRKWLCRDPRRQGGRQSRHARRGTASRAGIQFRRGRRLGAWLLMRAIVSLCVRHFGAVTALSLFALILGCWGAMHAPLDVFPEFVPSQVDIQTEAPGFAPQQVEELVTKQVENAVNGAPGLATLRSESIPGLSVVTITFTDGIDVHIARQGISERLSELGSSLPAGVGTPKLSPLVSSTMDLLKIGLLSDKLDAYALRDTADWIIKPRLLAVPGVAHVIVFGGEVRQIQIQPDMAKLASFGITLTQVGGCGARRAADTRRGLHRLARPARAHQNADPAARHRRLERGGRDGAQRHARSYCANSRR